MLAAIGVAAAGGVAGATRVPAPAPTTFRLTRLQAEEIAALVGFLRAYNRADLKSALGYFTTKPNPQSAVTATDCD